jgi:hypothetical protein
MTFLPSSRKIEAIILTTLDLPRVPVTLMRRGMEFLRRFMEIRS